MYYKNKDNILIDQSTAKELFKVNPTELNFSITNAIKSDAK